MRTTLSLNSEVYEEARSHFRDWGFPKLGDLISAALADYIERRLDAERDRAMQEAACDPLYLSALRRISQDLVYVDAEGLGPEY